jgi:hypothetical protein
MYLPDCLQLPFGMLLEEVPEGFQNLAALFLLKDSFDRYLARWGSADRMREYNGQMGLWVSKVQSTLTAAVVL